MLLANKKQINLHYIVSDISQSVGLLNRNTGRVHGFTAQESWESSWNGVIKKQ